MSRRICTCALVALLAPSGAIAQTVPSSDVQQWTEFAVNTQLTSKLTTTAFGEARIGADVTALDEELASAGLTYLPRPWMSVGTGYLYLHANAALSGLDHENRIYGEATFKAPALRGFALSDRVRPELRWLQLPSGAVSTPRYRNRVVVERPLAIAYTRMSPFAMWEMFYDGLAHAWSRTRSYAGVTVPVAVGTTMQVYWMHQSDAYAPPYRKNAVGVSMLRQVRGAHRDHPHE